MTGIESSRTAQLGLYSVKATIGVMVAGTLNYWLAQGLNIFAEGPAIDIGVLLDFYAVCLTGTAGGGALVTGFVGARHFMAKEQSSALRRLKRSLTKPKDRPLTAGPGAP